MYFLKCKLKNKLHFLFYIFPYNSVTGSMLSKFIEKEPLLLKWLLYQLGINLLLSVIETGTAKVLVTEFSVWGPLSSCHLN
jgi:hypothetical protein